MRQSDLQKRIFEHPWAVCPSDLSKRACQSQPMGSMRRVLRGQVPGRATAMLLAYLIVLQALIAGLTSATSAATSVDPFHIICSSSEPISVDSDSGDAPVKHTTECPCATLCCRAASTSVPPVVAPEVLPLPFAPSAAVEAPPYRSPVASRAERRCASAPRAPPAAV